MEVRVRRSEKSGNWGVIENFKSWRYKGKGYVEVLAGVDVNTGKFVMPYVYKGHEFISADKIHNEVGIDRYVAAKKPFFTVIDNAIFMNIRVSVNYMTNTIDIESAEFKAYIPELVVSETAIVCKKVQIPAVVEGNRENLISMVGNSFGDRTKFMVNRLQECE